MSDQIINPQTAELATLKGFREKTLLMYASQVRPQLESYNDIKYNLYKDYHLAPTQTHLQKWLRESHNLHPHVCFLLEEKIWNVDVYDLTNENGLLNEPFSMQGNSYEDVLEKGLFKALNYLKTVQQ